MSEQGWSAWQDEIAAGKAVQGAGLITKTCDVLDLIGKAPESITVAEMRRQIGIPRATLYRILAALVARGLVRPDPVTQTYSLGFRFLEFAQNVWASADIAAIAATELRRLREITGETTYLVVPHHQAALTLGRFEGRHEHRSMASLGVSKPLHCTSQGKAILAFWPAAKLDHFISHTPLLRYTERTITNASLLRAQLEITRSRGYAIDNEEILAGIRCVGAPVLDAAGQPIAAVSVAGPIYRMTSERAHQLGPELIDVTRRISIQLGRPLSGAAHTDQAANVAAISQTRAFHGMAPVWDAQADSLIWADRLAPSLQVSGTREWTLPLGNRAGPIQAMMLGGDVLSVLIGGLVLCVRGGEIVHERAAPQLASIRAVQVDPQGNPWAATLSETDGTAMIGRLGERGLAEAEWSTRGTVTALAWDPEARFLYAADPERGLIFALEPRTRQKRLFASIPKVSGMPVALATDRMGQIWIALQGGWSVARLTPDGEIDHVVALPVPCPTGLAFGGSGGSTLYITTASNCLPLEAFKNAPLSGRLLAIEAGVQGYIVPAATSPI